jgi:hypothetical protein
MMEIDPYWTQDRQAALDNTLDRAQVGVHSREVVTLTNDESEILYRAARAWREFLSSIAGQTEKAALES